MKGILFNLLFLLLSYLSPLVVTADPLICSAPGRNWLNCYNCISTACTNCVAGFEPAADGRCNRCGGGKYGNGGQSTCTTCPAGTYAPSASTQCYPCPGGTYSAAGAAGCSSCLVGQYSDSTSGSTSCTSCPSGTYATTAVASRAGCINCPAGQSSSPGSTFCTACAAGQYTVSGSASCTNCIAGTWSNSGDGTCTPCAGGSYSGAGAATCTACGPGTYAPPGSSGCTQCPAGTWVATSAGACNPCAAGTYSSTAGAINPSSCLPCGVGEYSLAGSTQCSICKAGTFSTGNAGSCTNCPAGEYSSTGAGSCLQCSAGQYSVSGSSSCTTCPAGTYSASAGAGSCTTCNAGQYSSSGSTSCQTCTAGQYSAAGADSCSTCPGGQYSIVATASCNLCSAGSYSVAGSSSCTTCLDGQYSGDGAASCTTCGPGKYSHAGASLCSTCEAGKYSPGGVAACSTCPAGKYSNAGASSCTTCSAGYYSGAGSPSCTICPGGTYSLANSASCTDCPAGRFSSSGAGVCSLCPAGQYSGIRSISCSICPIGTYSLQDSASCTLCPSGTYSPSAGAPALTSCLACPAGQYSDSGASSCKICPAGSHSSTGASSCNLCPGGYFSAPSSASCTICPPGQYSSAGSPSCSLCIAGMYSPAGSQSCILCEAGQYSSPGSGACLTCLAGQFSNAGSSSCTTCPAGYNSSIGAAGCGICAGGQFSNAGSEFCTLCPEGTFSSLPGATSFGACMFCPEGYYSKEGAAFCLMCLAGTYSLGGVSECTDCPSGQYSHDGASTCFTTTDNLLARATAISSSVVSKIGSSLCVGSSMFANLGLITKLVQNIRYMKLNVSNELDNAFKSWESDILAWQMPGKLSSMSDSETLPFVFARYELDSRFLVNYWFTLITIIIGFIVYGFLRLIKFFMEARLKKYRLGYSIFDGMISAAFNFSLVQIYTTLCDIVFYSILDLRFTEFSPKFSLANSLLAIFLLITGVLILVGHFWIVYRYTKHKKISERSLERFTQKFSLVKVLYEDYKDTGYLKHAYFAFMVTRAMLASLIIVAFYEQPLAQAVMLVLMNCLMLSFLVLKGPFKGVYNELMQYFYELIVFIVHFCVLLMAIADQKGDIAYNMRIRIGQCIIFLNTLLFLGSLVFMCIEVYRKLLEIYEAWLEYRRTRKLVKRQSTPQLLRAQSLGNTTYIHHETSMVKGRILNKSDTMDLFDSSSIINQETSMSPQRRGLDGSSEINVIDFSLENSADGLPMMMNSRKIKSQIKAKKGKKEEEASENGSEIFNLSLIRSGFVSYGGDTNLGSNKSNPNDLKYDGIGGDLSRNLRDASIKGWAAGENSSINSELNAKNQNDDAGVGRDLSRHLRDSPSKWDNQSDRSTPIGIKQGQKASRTAERSKSPLSTMQEDRLRAKDSPSRYQYPQEKGDLSGFNSGPSLSFESNFRKGSEAQDLLSQEKTDFKGGNEATREKGDLNGANKVDGGGLDLKKIAERAGQKQGKLATALIDNEIDALDRLIEDNMNKKNRTRNEEIQKGIVDNKEIKSESESPQRRKRNNVKVKAAGSQDPNMTQLQMLGAFNNKFREDILSQYSGFAFQPPGDKPGDKK